MRDCPGECGSLIANNARHCNACGWDAEPTRGAVRQREHRCEWRASGEQCHYFGTLSPSLHAGGPWYCRGHFGCDSPSAGAAIVEESLAAMRGVVDWTATTAKLLAAERTGSGSESLTSEQWYAVCRFWPNVAKRSSRQAVAVGPHHPLDNKVSQGPMFRLRLVVDREAEIERLAIQEAD